MRCPFATWQPVGNYTATAIMHVGCVIHVTAGESNPWGWFDNPASQASSHFFIGNGQGGTPDGALYQYVDTDLKAWAEAAGNLSYVSVETEGEPTDPLTQNQILAYGRLYAWLVETYKIPLVITDTPGSAGLITHGDGGVAWGDHPDCPGPARTSQRGAILYIAWLLLNPTPSPPTQGDENMLAGDPGSKSGSWALQPDGGIYTADGAQFLGSMAGNRWNWQAVGALFGIAAWWDGAGWGYKVAVRASSGGISYYRFPTNGSLRTVGAAVASDQPAAVEAAKDTSKWESDAGTVEAVDLS